MTRGSLSVLGAGMRQGNKYDKILVCKYLGQADDLAAGLKYSSESLQIQGLQ
jgi:hypothetical protein